MKSNLYINSKNNLQFQLEADIVNLDKRLKATFSAEETDLYKLFPFLKNASFEQEYIGSLIERCSYIKYRLSISSNTQDGTNLNNDNEIKQKKSQLKRILKCQYKKSRNQIIDFIHKKEDCRRGEIEDELLLINKSNRLIINLILVKCKKNTQNKLVN